MIIVDRLTSSWMLGWWWGSLILDLITFLFQFTLALTCLRMICNRRINDNSENNSFSSLFSSLLWFSQWILNKLSQSSLNSFPKIFFYTLEVFHHFKSSEKVAFSALLIKHCWLVDPVLRLLWIIRFYPCQFFWISTLLIMYFNYFE